jgi:hypothetical protein
MMNDLSWVGGKGNIYIHYNDGICLESGIYEGLQDTDKSGRGCHMKPWLGFPGLWEFSQVCYYGHFLHKNNILLCFNVFWHCPWCIQLHSLSTRISLWMWTHRKWQSGQRYDEIRADFVLCFNKADLTETSLCKFKKKMFLTSSMSETK